VKGETPDTNNRAQMNNLKHYCFVLLLGFLMASCDKDKPMVPPDIRSGEASDVTNTTAVINGEIVEAGSLPVLNYGFVWQEDNDDALTMESGNVEFLNGEFKKGKISCELKNLEQGKSYYFQAFVQTETETYSGDKSWFNMARPEISDISPKEGVGGTKVTLTGKYFSSDPKKVKVILGDKEAEILEASETEISFIAPEGYKGNRDIGLKLVVNGVHSPSEVVFKYLNYFKADQQYVRPGQQFMVKISTTLVYVRDNGQLAINVKINGQLCPYLSDWPTKTGYEIYVVIPEDLTPGEVTIEVTNDKGYKYFDKGNPVTVLPSGTWSRKQNLPHGNMGKGVGFAKEDVGYVLSGNKLYRYDRGSDSWTLIKELLSLEDKESKGVYLVDQELYILQDKTLKCYNFIGGYTQAKTEFPGVLRSGGVSFVADGKLYYGLGYIYGEYQNDLWAYDTTSDVWTRMSDCPERNHESTYQDDRAVVLDGKVVIGNLSYDYKRDQYQDSEVKLWHNEICFMMNNRLYFLESGYGQIEKKIVDGETKYYNSTENVIRISDYDFTRGIKVVDKYCPGTNSKSFFTFAVDGKIYIGINNTEQELWEFTPGE
jgi:hypothetical protein